MLSASCRTYGFAALLLAVLLLARPAVAQCVSPKASFVISIVGAEVRLRDCRNGTYAVFTYLNEALDSALSSLSLGGFILVTGGNYLLSNVVELEDNVTIAGEVDANGYPTTVVQLCRTQLGCPTNFPNSHAFRNFQNNSPTYTPTATYGIVLENLVIQAHGTFGVGYQVLSLRKSVGAVVRNVKIIDPVDVAFVGFHNTNLLFERCEASKPASNSNTGHGFSIGGSDVLGSPDVGTTLLDCAAHGFKAIVPGAQSEGVLTRDFQVPGCTPGPGCAANIGTRIVGGEFHDNGVGIRIRDVLNGSITGVNVHDNYAIGVEEYPAQLDPAYRRLAILGSTIHNNGNNSNVNEWGPSGGVVFRGANSSITNSDLFDNWPNNIVADHADAISFYVTNSKLFGCKTLSPGCPTPPCQPYHVRIGNTLGWLIGNFYGPNLFSRFDPAVPPNVTDLAAGALTCP